MRNGMAWGRAFSVLFLALGLGACGGSSGSAPTPVAHADVQGAGDVAAPDTKQSDSADAAAQPDTQSPPDVSADSAVDASLDDLAAPVDVAIDAQHDLVIPADDAVDAIADDTAPDTQVADAADDATAVAADAGADAVADASADAPDVPTCIPFCLPGSCADDGCGKPCACGSGLACDGAGKCTACGVCAPGMTCNAADGKCYGADCNPMTDNATCDASGQILTTCTGDAISSTWTSLSCATLGKGWACYNNSVITQAACLPPANCAGKACGPDGVGGTCGSCDAGKACSTDFQCIDVKATCGTCADWATCGSDKGANVCQGPAWKCIGVNQLGQCENNNLFEICTGNATYSTDCGFVSGGKDYCGLSVKTGAYGCIPKPQCSGKACGWDGVGLSCGTCPADKACDATGQCIPAPTLGDTCATPFVVDAVPFTKTSSTVGMTDSLWTTGECPGPGAYHGITLPDAVYAFTPGKTGSYKLSLLPIAVGTNMPTALYVTTSCADIASQCSAYSGDLYNEGKGGSMTTKLLAGTPYFIVVDGLHPGDVGPYTFKVEQDCVPNCVGAGCGDDTCGGSCGTCGGGDACVSGQCANPDLLLGNNCAFPNILTPGVPVDVSATTAGLSDDFQNLCGVPAQVGLGAPDATFTFTPIWAGTYTITVTGFNAAIYVRESCDGSPWDCVGATNALESATTHVLHVKLQGLTPYTIIVDGVTTMDQGSFNLKIDTCQANCLGIACGADGCGGTCGNCPGGKACNGSGQCVDEYSAPGNTCSLPYAIATLPFAAKGSTQFATDLYTLPDGATCGTTSVSNSVGAGNPDVVYAYTPKTDGMFNVQVLGKSAYVLGDCSQAAKSCTGIAGSSAPIQVAGKAGTATFIVIDGSTQYDADYVLNVTPCVPQCTGKTCGADGCGGTCGTCSGGQTCDQTDGVCTTASCKHRCGHTLDACSCTASGTACADFCSFCALDAPQKCAP